MKVPVKEKLTVRDRIPVIRPVLIVKARYWPLKYSMFNEGGFKPFGKCPIYKI